jgi:hypothetical protein
MIMQRHTNLVIIGVIIFLLAGCATLKDVQRSTDLIRTDNELARILSNVRPNDQFSAETDLAVLANHAKAEAEALEGDQGKILDTIAYYRIASTAYWRSGKPEVINDLFETANKGSDLCAKLADKAPDRDCVFLGLVIPFAGLESNANKTDLSGLLDSVNFNDESATEAEIQTMQKIHRSLGHAKPLVNKILMLGKDNRLLSHPGMREYYCGNAKNANSYYTSTAAVFITKVKEFHSNFPNHTPPLEITVEKAREIRKQDKAVPSFCQQ